MALIDRTFEDFLTRPPAESVGTWDSDAAHDVWDAAVAEQRVRLAELQDYLDLLD